MVTINVVRTCSYITRIYIYACNETSAKLNKKTLIFTTMAKMQEDEIKVHKTKEPFSIVENKGMFFVTIGNNVMSNKQFKELKEARNYVNSKPYELIINLACFCMEQSTKIKNNERETKTNC